MWSSDMNIISSWAQKGMRLLIGAYVAPDINAATGHIDLCHRQDLVNYPVLGMVINQCSVFLSI